LKLNTSGSGNTAVGQQALQDNTTGATLTAIGTNALANNTTGASNVAIGYQAAITNTTGAQNIAIGENALFANTTGTCNVGIGHLVLDANTTGTFNTAVGHNAGGALTTGDYNTFIGTGTIAGTGNFGAGDLMTTGDKNTFLGGYNGNQNSLDLRTANNNIVLSDGDGRPFVWGRASGTHIYSYESGAATAFVSAINSTNTSSQIIRGANSAANITDVGASVFVVFGNGNVQNTNNSYGAISDVKLKENIADASSQWNDIKAIKVRKYSMIADSESEANRLGVIAQELEASGMSGLVDEHIDLGPNDENLGTTTKGVKYSVLYMKAIKALQEAMEKIESLEERVTTLEG